MAYHFNFIAATKDEAKLQAAQQIDAHVATDPWHGKTRDAAVATVNALVDLLPDDPAKAVAVYVVGGVSFVGVWTPQTEATALSVHAGASLVDKPE